MVVAAEKITEPETSRNANCAICLTRDCPLNGMQDFPVRLCNTYREANCAFCATKTCALNGRVNSPVLACDGFHFLHA